MLVLKCLFLAREIDGPGRGSDPAWRNTRWLVKDEGSNAFLSWKTEKLGLFTALGRLAAPRHSDPAFLCWLGDSIVISLPAAGPAGRVLLPLGPQGWLGIGATAGAGCPEGLWSLCPWRYSEAVVLDNLLGLFLPGQGLHQMPSTVT